MIFLSYRL